MPIKGILIGSAVAASVAGIAFGGTAVSTAFSSNVTGNATVTADKIDLTANGQKSIDLNVYGLEPGSAAPDRTFYLKNNGPKSGALYLTDVTWNPTNNADGSAPDPTKLLITVSDSKLGKTLLDHARVSDLVGGVVKVLAPGVANSGISAIPAGVDDTITVSVSLDGDAGNDWNGATARVGFNLHLQDLGSSQAHGYVQG
jgi:hypothetical protein